jgi:hypothetical protein
MMTHTEQVINTSHAKVKWKNGTELSLWMRITVAVTMSSSAEPCDQTPKQNAATIKIRVR